MTTNREVFDRDPTTYTIPNDGVAKVVEPRSDEEWKVARYEMEYFVCEGSYHNSLKRILESFLDSLGQPNQHAIWVHGFYGCGKSHLVRVLEFLWRDIRFPDGATARGLVNLPESAKDIRDALIELSNAGRQRGGLWSAAGTLGAGSTSDPRAAMLAIVLRSAGLPERVNLAQFDLWLREEGWLDTIKSGLEQQGRRYERELQNLFVSTPLAEELLRVNPNFAPSPAAALQQIRAQYPNIEEVTTDTMVETMRQVFALMSNKPNKLPCVLLVLDELQQYLGDSHERTEIVREAVEACVSRFGSNLLFVATGQLAMTATPILQRLQGRFTIQIAIEDKDTDQVLRQTVLRKKPTAEPELSSLLDSAKGEIDRHLWGSQIEPQSTDSEFLVQDYPLLPTRRRFWQKVLRGLDRSGTAAQLRTQLRLAHEAAATVAHDEIGCVVGGDFIFEQQRPALLQTAVLLREVNEAIAKEDDGTPDGNLRARICALLFLIKEIDAAVGIRATADTLADLLVTDLRAGSSSLRQKIPELLKDLVERAVIMQVGDEYQIQTREGTEWDRDYRSRATAIRGNDARISQERERILRTAVESLLKGLTLTQGTSKTPRQYNLHFGSDAPVVEAKVPVWIRSGWDIAEPAVKREAEQAGANSPIVFVYLPKHEVAEDLKAHIAGYLGAEEVLQTKPTPTTDEGKMAKFSVQARKDTHYSAIQDIISNILENAKVFQGGGVEV